MSTQVSKKPQDILLSESLQHIKKKDLNTKIKKQSKVPHVRSTKPLLFHNIHYERSTSVPSSSLPSTQISMVLPNQFKTKKRSNKSTSTSCNFSLQTLATIPSPGCVSLTPVYSSFPAQTPDSLSSNISTCISTTSVHPSNTSYKTTVSGNNSLPYQRKLDRTSMYNGSCLFHWKVRGNKQESTPKKDSPKPTLNNASQPYMVTEELCAMPTVVLKSTQSSSVNPLYLNSVHQPPIEQYLFESCSSLMDHRSHLCSSPQVSRTQSPNQLDSNERSSHSSVLSNSTGSSNLSKIGVVNNRVGAKILPSIHESNISIDLHYSDPTNDEHLVFLPPLQFIESALPFA